MGRRHFAKGVQCPFGEECPQCRPEAARIVNERRIVFSSDLKRELKKRVWCGEGAARKALKFLHHTEKDKQCNERDVFGCERHIEAWRKVEERRAIDKSNVIYFGEKGRAVDKSRNKLFFLKPAKLGLIGSEIRKGLTCVQDWLLRSFEEQRFGTYYLSSFETRKLAPYPEGHVSNSLDRLLDIGFLKEVTWDISKIHKPYKKIEIIPIEEISNEGKMRAYKAKKRLDELEKKHEPSSEYKLDFLTTAKLKKTLDNSKQSVLEELVEYEVVKQVHMRLLQKYRLSVKRCAVRTQDLLLSKLTKGYNFDIFCEFRDGSRLGSDIFTRLPLSEAAVRVFARKIKAVGCIGRIYTRDCQSDRVDSLCRISGINIIYLRNTSINIPKIRQKIEARITEANLW